MTIKHLGGIFGRNPTFNDVTIDGGIYFEDGQAGNYLDDYEEGTWTPIDSSGAGLTFSSTSGLYTKVGRMVFATGFVTYPSTADTSNVKIGGFPFHSINSTARGVGSITYKQSSEADTILPDANATTFRVFNSTGSSTTNANLSNEVLYFGIVYTSSV